jgi:hypothetical protein
MILVRLCGGLGNQLFQYAAGRRLAHARGAELVLDLGWYAQTPSSNTPRKYELAHYPIQARTTTRAEDWWCRFHSGRLLRRLPIIPRRWHNFREKAFDFDRSVLDLPDDTYLDGYWQSHCYFEDIADAIRAEATPLKPAGPRDMAVNEKIVATASVSLHVRRGDYVTHKAAAGVHGTCSVSYYQKALAKIASLVRNPHFFIFSDDVEWARSSIATPGPNTFVDHNGPEAAFQDLRLMSLCKHHVIANSSFSWWGAWLNPNEEKVVVSPQAWFADGRATRTLIPSTWIRL